jgi:hypothetical protein
MEREMTRGEFLKMRTCGCGTQMLRAAYIRSGIHRSLTGDKSQLWHRVVVPARQPCSLACRYDNPMQELTLSPSQGSMNWATGFIASSPVTQKYRTMCTVYSTVTMQLKSILDNR